MERNTKILIGLAAAGVVAYFVFKSKKPKAPISKSKCSGLFSVECNDGSCDVANGIVRACASSGVKGTNTNSYEKPVYQGTYDKPNPNDFEDLFKYRQTCGDGYRTNNPEVDCKTRGGYNTGVAIE